MIDEIKQLLELRKEDKQNEKDFRDLVLKKFDQQWKELTKQSEQISGIYTQTKLTNGRVTALELLKKMWFKWFAVVSGGVAIAVLSGYVIGHFIH